MTTTFAPATFFPDRRPVGKAVPLRPWEAVMGLALGPTAQESFWPAEHSAARTAFDWVVCEALRRPPCVVSFSGGRDSSVLLTLATLVARRDGLPLPIPATLNFPGDAAADEASYQNTILDHLRLPERLMVNVTDELDAVGPVATTLLSRHGLLWPFNTHMHGPIVAAAAGGSVITGFGGDEVGRASQSAHAAQLLARQRQPHPVDVLVLGLQLGPSPVRRVVERRRERAVGASLPWATRRARRAIGRVSGDHSAAVPVSYAKRLRWFGSSRYRQICESSFALMGSDFEVQLVHPFVDPRVLAALASDGGYAGFGSRTAMLERIFGDIVPRSVTSRLTKASFSNPLWSTHAKQFAQDWNGDGVDPDWVDVEALRSHWRAGDPDVRSLTLLQQAWLASNGQPARTDDAR